MSLHLGEQEVLVEVDVEHVVLPVLVSYHEAVVLAGHEPHGVQLGDGHVLVRRLTVEAVAGGDVHAPRVIRRVGDGGVGQQVVVVVHVAVVRRDLEGEIPHVHAVALGILQHDAQLVGVLDQRYLFLLVAVAGDDERVQRVPEGCQFIGLGSVGLSQRLDAYLLDGGGSGREVGRPLVGAVVQSGPREHLVGAGIEVHHDVVRLQLGALDVLPPDKVTLVVADKQSGSRSPRARRRRRISCCNRRRNAGDTRTAPMSRRVCSRTRRVPVSASAPIDLMNVW